MSNATFIVGDSLTVLRAMPDASVDLIVTSPPFLALRSYLPADHPDKALEVGSEATPAAFIDTLLEHTAEWRRVLAPHGSLCVELGDTYSGSGGAGGDYGPDGLREGQPKFRAGTPRWDGRPEGQVRTTTSDPVSYPTRGKDGWPMDKSLALIPELYRLALAYGINPLTGQPSPAGRWRVRNVVRWHRPNPPVGALGDKFRPATSDMVVACTSRTRYFDLDAVREPHKPSPGNVYGSGDGQRGGGMDPRYPEAKGPRHSSTPNPAGAPPLDTWVIPTAPYAGSHYATFPPALVTRPIQAMCPQRVCVECGEPSRRITETEREVNGVVVKGGDWSDHAVNGWKSDKDPSNGQNTRTIVTTLGWSDCDHGNFRTGLVLDPFAGSGTTLAVATGHGRDAIGVDLDDRNALLAEERVGSMFLEVVHHDPEARGTLTA